MKVSFYLTRSDIDSETAIYARICYNGNKLKWYTTESIRPIYWNTKKQEAKKSASFEDGPGLNERLDQIKKDISRVFRRWVNDNNGTIPLPHTLKVVLDVELKKIEPQKLRSATFFPYFEELIQRTEQGIRMQPGTGKRYSKATITTYKTIINRLKSFAKTYKRTIDFNTIDQNFYEDYTSWLSKKMQFALNTIGKDIKTIKVVLNDATAKGISLNPAFKSRSFSVVSEDVDAIYLNEKELTYINKIDLSDTPRLDKVRDLFLIACYTGLRYSDVSRLNADHFTNDGLIEIVQQKTGDKVVIPVHKVVSDILLKYDNKLPDPISNQKFNTYLREVCERAESLKVDTKFSTHEPLKVSRILQKWELVTAHAARRSFATNEYLAGTQTVTIMAITGHKTERSFLKYIKLSSKEHAIELKQAWQKRMEQRSEMIAVN